VENLIPFAGRQKELGFLDEYFEDALDYNGGFILVKGETGSGKTRLLQHFEERTRDHNLHVLRGRTRKDETRSFSPFTFMVKHFLCNLDMIAGGRLNTWSLISPLTF
jgi:predicted ATPase